MIVKPSLDVLVFSITKKCNLNCSFCSRNAISSSNQHLDESIIIKRVRELLKNVKPVVIGITGGEPLLYPKIFTLLKKLNKFKIPLRLSTNCTLCTKEIVKKLKDLNIEQINLSLDGPNEEIHDLIRGKGSFKKTMDGINNLKESKLSFFLKTTITKQNYLFVDKILELSIALGAKGFAVSRVIPIGRALNNKTYEISWDDYNKSIKKCLAISKNNKIKFLIDDPLKCLIDKDLLDYVKREYKSFNEVWGGCRAGIKILYIMSNGDIIPCPALPLKIGNVYKEDLYTVWNNSRILKNLRKKEVIKGTCHNCKYLHICGGCRAMAYSLTGDYLNSDPFCPFVE